jgi:hypothetical protein
MRPDNIQFMTALDASTNKSSSVIPASFLTSGSVQASFSSNTLNGTITVQASNDPLAIVNSAGVITPVNWNTIGTANTITSGATVMQNIDVMHYAWIRVLWTAGSGTGTLSVNGQFWGLN